MTNQTKSDPHSFHLSMDELSSVLSSTATPFTIPTEGTPLAQAFDLVIQSMKIDQTPKKIEEQSLEELCRCYQVRYRKIILKKGWWEKQQGHLIGFLSEKQTPVAIIQQGSKQFLLVDPATRKTVPIDEHIEKDLLPIAYMIYEPLPKKAKTLFELMKFSFGNLKKEYTSLFGISLLTILVSFLFPFANKVLFDRVIPHYSVTLFTQVIFWLGIAAISSTLFSFAQSAILLRLQGILRHRMQMGVWDRVLRLPVSFFRKFQSGDLIQRTSIINRIQDYLNGGTLKILVNSIFSLSYLVVMLFFSPLLTLIGTGVLLIAASISAVLFLLKIRYERDILESNATLNSFLIQVIQGIGKIRTAVAEHRIFAHWAKEFAHNQRLTKKARTLQNIIITLNAGLAVLSSLLLFGIVMFMQGTDPSGATLSTGSFLAFYAAYTPFSQAIFEALQTIIGMVTLIPFWERVRPLFTTPTEESPSQSDPGILKGNIQVKNISFRYDQNTPYVLENVSIEAKPGELIGLVGTSGSGKSTLCRLLVAFETPEEGQILFDGKDLQNIIPSKLRPQIGTILQNSTIFSGSIYENITCGRNTSPEQIKQAIEFATFDEDLSQMPMGLDTMLITGGTTLSGGQKQRLLLTRALIGQPKMLILDEATSSLDNRIQDQVAHHLDSLNITRIVVAHRLSTVQHADRIYVFEQGKIVQEGTFQELLKQKGPFANFAKRQKM